MRHAALILASIVLAGGQSSVPLRDLHESGIAHHLERSLTEASDVYDDVLRRDPPRAPTDDEWAMVARFAPRLFVTRTEPFELKDAAAIVHPRTQTIAYHLFWDDDIDFPDDNEPSDHEVLWCVPSKDGATIGAFYTYFHGRLLRAGPEALRDARTRQGRPSVFVQWGKHGLMPLGWETMTIQAEDGETESDHFEIDRPISLLDYNRATWRRLTTEGRRERRNPIAERAGWPERFDGDWAGFSTFPVAIDPLPRMQKRKMALVTEWNAAALNRWLIRYNFRPKLEWPDETGVEPR